MRQLAHIFTTLTILLTACGKDSDGSSNFSGIGTVEKNDTAVAIHYYERTLTATDSAQLSAVREGDRVYFICSAWREDGDTTYNRYVAYFNDISSDLRREIVFTDSTQTSAEDIANSHSAEGFYAQNVHITRDWQRNDFFEAMLTYPASDGHEDDFIALVRDTTMDKEEDFDGQVFWLRLSRHRTDSVYYINRHISVPINCLRDSTKERISMLVKRIDHYGDTVSTSFVYSYVNWPAENY